MNREYVESILNDLCMTVANNSIISSVNDPLEVLTERLQKIRDKKKEVVDKIINSQ
jgi:hypothetical protein